MASRGSEPPDGRNRPPQGNRTEDRRDKKTNDSNIMESDFILLDELVYAPLHALAESDQRLRAQVVNAVKIMGSLKQNGQEEVIHLDNINIAYDQVRQEGEEGYSVDNLQL